MSPKNAEKSQVDSTPFLSENRQIRDLRSGTHSAGGTAVVEVVKTATNVPGFTFFRGS
jgi:hypothetical protein